MLQQALTVQGAPTKWQLLDKYAEHLRSELIKAINHPQHKDKPLTGLKIAVDAGNGSGGFFASKVCVCVFLPQPKKHQGRDQQAPCFVLMF